MVAHNDEKNERNKKTAKELNEEFAEPLDEHSIEEEERAQRTGSRSESTHFNENDVHHQEEKHNR